MKLFQRLAADISALIRDGTLRLGERIPSVREISRERNLSTATVVHAYEMLEGQGFIETRPRSGFYVSGQWKTHVPALRTPKAAGVPVVRTTRPRHSRAIRSAPAGSWRTSGNPLGALVPEDTKRELVTLLDKH